MNRRCQSCHRTPIQAFQKTFSEHRGRPIQRLITAWRACSVSASTSCVRGPDESQASASLTPSSSRHFPLCRSLPRERGDRDAVAATEPNPLNRAPLSDSSEPQHHCELLHVHDHTVISFSPQVELTVSAAPPGRHDRRRPSSHMAVLLEPLTVPSLPCARSCECY